ncbi:unnamed protein product [Oikopleura dioica]|uniref:DRBM domain-containing protein n=1 Tax=Oikopleura dioica TaxID=34765 RepID=E4X0X4_OIKDI|nr:unnamed protein product [Oikopleura dioica]
MININVGCTRVTLEVRDGEYVEVFLDRAYCDAAIDPDLFKRLYELKKDRDFFNERQQKFTFHFDDLPEGDKFFNFLTGKQISLPDAKSVNMFQKCCYFFNFKSLAGFVEGKQSASICLAKFKTDSGISGTGAEEEFKRRVQNTPLQTSSPRAAPKRPPITSPFAIQDNLTHGGHHAQSESYITKSHVSHREVPDPSSTADQQILNAQRGLQSMTLNERIQQWDIASHPDNPPISSVASVKVTPEGKIPASRELRRNEVDPDGNLMTRVDHESENDISMDSTISSATDYANNPINVLQETLQKDGLPCPVYETHRGKDGKFEAICRASSEETRAFDQSENEAKRKAAHQMMKLLRNSDSSEIREYEEMPSTADAVQFLQDNLVTKKRTKMGLPTGDPRSVFNLLQQQFPGFVELGGLGKNDFKFSGYDHCREFEYCGSARFRFTNLDKRIQSIFTVTSRAVSREKKRAQQTCFAKLLNAIYESLKEEKSKANIRIP